MLRKVAIGCGALIILGGIVLVAVFFYVDANFGVRSAPVIGHAEVLDPTADIRISVKPAYDVDIVREMVATRAPEFPAEALDSALPNEIAITLDMSPDAPRFDTAFFMNPTRFGPVIAQTIAPVMLNTPSETLSWIPPGLQRIRPGVLEARGALKLDDDVVQEWERDWEAGGRHDVLPLNGNHLIEMNIDNRNGALFILYKMSETQPLEDNVRTLLYDALKATSDLNITMDPVGEEGYSLNILANTKPNAPEGSESVLRNLFGFAAMGARPELLNRYGLTLDGKATLEGRNVVGRYTLGPRSQVIALLLGEATTPQPTQQ